MKYGAKSALSSLMLCAALVTGCAPPPALSANLCSLSQNPSHFGGREVELTTVVLVGAHGSVLVSEDCPDAALRWDWASPEIGQSDEAQALLRESRRTQFLACQAPQISVVGRFRNRPRLLLIERITSMRVVPYSYDLPGVPNAECHEMGVRH